jgi:hypothetical protein
MHRLFLRGKIVLNGGLLNLVGKINPSHVIHYVIFMTLLKTVLELEKANNTLPFTDVEYKDGKPLNKIF